MDESPAMRLDRLMNSRRLDLDLDWKDVADRAGIAIQTLVAVRKGDNRPTERTQRKIERALEWEHGSIAAIWRGGGPTPLPVGRPTEPEPTIAEMAARVAETNARVSAMAAKIEALQRQLDDERAERRREAG